MHGIVPAIVVLVVLGILVLVMLLFGLTDPFGIKVRISVWVAAHGSYR